MSSTDMNYTQEEQKNIDLAKEYMLIAYDPKRASAEAVTHLCAPGNKFIAPTTFPNVHTLEEYAEDHAKIMQQVNDLHFGKLAEFIKDWNKLSMWEQFGWPNEECLTQ